MFNAEMSCAHLPVPFFLYIVVSLILLLRCFSFGQLTEVSDVTRKPPSGKSRHLLTGSTSRKPVQRLCDVWWHVSAEYNQLRSTLLRTYTNTSNIRQRLFNGFVFFLKHSMFHSFDFGPLKTLWMFLLALRYTTSDGAWRDSAARLTAALANIRTITNHFSPKVDKWATANSLSSLTEDQVLKSGSISSSIILPT